MKVPPGKYRLSQTAAAEIRAALLHAEQTPGRSERSKTLALLYAADPDDVFSVTRLDGDQLLREPGLIADSASSQCSAMSALS